MPIGMRRRGYRPLHIGGGNLGQQLLALPGLLALWYAGDGTTTPDAMNGATDGGAVTTWNDLGTSGYHVTQASASAKPTYNKSVAALNNRSGVTFASANSQYLGRTLSGAIASGLTTFTIYAVFVTPSAEANKPFYSEGNSANGGLYLFVSSGVTDVTHIRLTHTSAVDIDAGSGANDGNAHLLTGRKITTSSYNLRKDGTSVGTAAADASALIDRLALGALTRTTITNFLNGTLACVAVFSTDIYATVEPIIAAHYGITLA